MKTVTIYTDGGFAQQIRVMPTRSPLAGQPLAWQARAV